MAVVSASRDKVALNVMLTHSDEIHFIGFPGFSFFGYLPKSIETKEYGNVDI